MHQPARRSNNLTPRRRSAQQRTMQRAPQPLKPTSPRGDIAPEVCTPLRVRDANAARPDAASAATPTREAARGPRNRAAGASGVRGCADGHRQPWQVAVDRASCSSPPGVSAWTAHWTDRLERYEYPGCCWSSLARTPARLVVLGPVGDGCFSSGCGNGIRIRLRPLTGAPPRRSQV